MKKKLLPITIGLLSIFFMVSCESDEPSFSTGPTPDAKEVNEWLYDKIFKENYLWDVPSSPDLSLEPEDFFKKLLDKNDTYSWLSKTANLPPATTTYDIGFEYAANKYNDGNIYYVVYYVKKGSDAESKGLRRGYIIGQVNGKKIESEKDAETLLSDAYKDGASVQISYIIPPESESAKVIDIVPTVQNLDKEDPLYTSNIIEYGSNKKIGYLVYNMFNAAYDNDLALKLKDFMDQGVNHLVLDLRYNAGGSLTSTQVLGSALVKDRDTSAPFMIYERRTDLKNTPLPFLDKTSGGAEIPKLGDQLEGLYIITGAYTSAASEVFINSLYAYTSTYTAIIGEKTAGLEGNNLAFATTKNDPKNDWTVHLPVAKMVNKDLKDSFYVGGIKPDKEVFEVSKDETELLYPLGDQEETVLYTIIINLDELKDSNRSATTYKAEGSRTISSSISQKPWAKQTTINLDDLK